MKYIAYITVLNYGNIEVETPTEELVKKTVQEYKNDKVYWYDSDADVSVSPLTKADVIADLEDMYANTIANEIDADIVLFYQQKVGEKKAVYITESVEGYAIIDAENEEEAWDQGWQRYGDGKIFWTNRKLINIEIKPVNPKKQMRKRSSNFSR